MCCMNVNCDNCLVNLEWTLIYLQKINPTQKIFKKVHFFGYRKSSINPPPRPFRGTVVSVLLKELEYKVKSSSKGRLEVMRPKSKSKSELPIKNTETNHSGSVQLKFYNHD